MEGESRRVSLFVDLGKLCVIGATAVAAVFLLADSTSLPLLFLCKNETLSFWIEVLRLKRNSHVQVCLRFLWRCG